MRNKLLPYTEEIIEKYNNGIGSSLLGKEYNCTHKTITLLLKKNNILIRGSKRLINHNPFKNLNDNEVQYWLGYIIADGNLFDKRISLFQTEKDIDVLHKYCNFLNISYNNIKKKKLQNPNWDNCYSVRFGNLETYHFLKSIGITENKSHTVNITIPITFPLLRGLLEGDGHFSIKKINTIKIILTTASIYLCNQVSSFLIKNNIKNSIYFNNGCYQIYTTSQENTRKLIKLIYPENCYPYNNRKYNKALSMLINNPKK